MAINDLYVRARYIRIATGAAVPVDERAISSDQAFQLPAFPEKVLICGAGYIAV